MFRGVCWNFRTRSVNHPRYEEIVMVDVRKMVWLMVLPVFTALICWAVWLAL